MNNSLFLFEVEHARGMLHHAVEASRSPPPSTCSHVMHGHLTLHSQCNVQGATLCTCIAKHLNGTSLRRDSQHDQPYKMRWTSSAIAKLLVNPGLSIPNKFTNPS